MVKNKLVKTLPLK